MATKRKTTTGIIAGVTAAALLLGGTFAWTSISQQAKNETAGIVNVGGRLHDDFNGTNKDVYVENFTDPLDGGQPIYARIKLTEYMEVGQDAGGFGADVNGDEKISAVPVISGTDINNEDTWKVFIPGSITNKDITCEDCGDGTTDATGACGIHDHWKWTVNGSTIFMPTFNKDKDSLEADINGTYAGTNPTDKVYYDDYVVYTTEDGGLVIDLTADFTKPDGAEYANALTEAGDNVITVTGNAQYDNDPDGDPNTTENDDYILKKETHTAKETGTATVITMAEWLANPVPGNYWVYDTDGWAYWANPIMPGEATGLLLDGIEMTKNPGEKCYYAINVVAQFSTVGDWENFYTDENSKEYDVSENAQTLLETASKNVATVVVTNVSGETLLTTGSSYEFSANVYVNGVEQYAASDFEWSVLNADGSANTKSSITDGMLTVSDSETSKNLVIVAKAKDANYLGALGMISVAVDVKDYSITVLPNTMADGEGGTYEQPYSGRMDDNETWTMQLMVGDLPITEGVTWSSELIASDSSGSELLEGTGIDANTGVFTVAEGEVMYKSGQYNSYEWHVVEVTASVEGEEPVKERFLLISNLSVGEELKFYEVGTKNAVYSSELLVGTEYDVRFRMWDQNTYTDVMTDYMNPISFEGAVVTITDSENNPTDKATLVDGKFVATEAGDYIINVTKNDAVYGEMVIVEEVTVYRADPALLPLINEIANATAVGSIASGGSGADIYNNGGTLQKVEIDGEEYFVVVKDETSGAERALLLKYGDYTFDVIEGGDGYQGLSYIKYGNSTKWADSIVNKLLNSTEESISTKAASGTVGGETDDWGMDVSVTPFLVANPTVSKLAVPTDISTRVYDDDGNYTYETTSSKVFIMSEADIKGTVGGEATGNTEDYTYVLNGEGVDLFEYALTGQWIGGDLGSYHSAWLRSTYGKDKIGYTLQNDVIVGNYPQGGYMQTDWSSDEPYDEYYYYGSAFPMFWVDISAADIYNAE